MDGMLLSRAVTKICRRGKAVMSRSTRSTRTRRSTAEYSASSGSRQNATIAKSETFQGSRKNRHGREPWAARRTSSSPTKSASTVRSAATSHGPSWAMRPALVSGPTKTPAIRINPSTNRWNAAKSMSGWPNEDMVNSTLLNNFLAIPSETVF